MSDERPQVNIRLDQESFDKLKRLAEEAGMYPGALAAALLLELLPTVKGVRRRLQVIRDGAGGSE
jgi:hypothetical protein